MDHFSGALLLGGFADFWASFLVADSSVQYLPDQATKFVGNSKRRTIASPTPFVPPVTRTRLLLNKVQNYQGANLADLARKGLPANYVERETRRAVAGVSFHSAEAAPSANTPGTPKIWPGIDIDIPTGPDEKKTEPQDVRDAVRAALNAGADGVILSRKYSEMRLLNLRAAERPLRG